MGALDQQVAIVTGAGRGVGRATAIRLAREGAPVIVNDIDEQVCRETAEIIGGAGRQALAVPGDLTDPGMSRRLVDAAAATFGRIDILVNNAGWVEVAPIRDIDLARWQRMIAINLDAGYLLLRAVGAQFVRQFRDGGPGGDPRQRKIVNVSSMAGVDGVAGSVHYSAAKAGVIGMTLAAAREWGRYAVNVNAVAFGVIRTRLTAGVPDDSGEASAMTVKPWAPGQFEALTKAAALGRPGTPDEAAAAIYFLCSPDSDYVSGHVLEVAGGP
ncbi:3-oxoacyl-[acyl-carrier protein] reductase [Thermocatellispora tengchongensis]|uniref:3-oxoacyl-[acyl-carrier protein] reductase n=1 Tax=Thermocatellispora tengchongensis TaxID=1073253 RepID=A0A840PIZ6_9ACTN|nr:SDR family NAD(P)-dependent oxidoreductase [Thermocatellispora tengchongensis]MBB5136045.1 3-oxoacyl-[acyl-carrier protein] reductase [Thermocatellispora tengchongensis]